MPGSLPVRSRVEHMFRHRDLMLKALIVFIALMMLLSLALPFILR